MSKKICRTCLKRTYKTYKTHENIYHPGENEQLKISDMLRYLVPELVIILRMHDFYHLMYLFL